MKRPSNDDLLISGLFLLIWSSSAPILTSEVVKIALLAVGFCLVMYVSFFSQRVSKTLLPFTITSSFIYFVMVAIGYYQQQDVLNFQNIAFGLICLGLLNAGYSLQVRYQSVNFKLNEYLPPVFSIIVIFTSVQFIKGQSGVNGLSRELGFDLNPVGLAYTQALLIIFLGFILIATKIAFHKVLSLFGMLSCLIIIIFTLSRGAVLFLMILGVLLSYRYIFHKGFAIFLLKGTIGLIAVILILNILGSRVPLIESKMQAILVRIEKLDRYVSSDLQSRDLSSETRESFYADFFSNWNDFTWGKKGYHPYPHNQYLEIYSRWGVFGIPVLVFSLFVFVRSMSLFFLFTFDEAPFLIFINSLFLFCYLQSMSSLSLEINRFLWFGFGYLFSFSFKKPKALA